jgi:hypothetical protein
MGGVRALAGAAAAVLLCACAPAAGAQIRAGVGVVDPARHVGASTGPYASGAVPGASEVDPSLQQVKNAPSYGVASRLQARAIVVADGAHKLALVKTDLYIPQDLLWRRAAQLLAAKGIGIGEENLVMSITHDHSSPYYTSTAWGAWTFQDVFDIRAYDYYAHRLAAAVEEADAHLVPARVGAATAQYALSNRNALGPAVADDGTPAGYPDSYTDRTMTLVRFDDITDPAHPKPLANLVNFSLHGENLEGNDLISADFIGPFERQLDRATGATTVWTQDAVGNSENERGSYHSIHSRLFFDHRQYAQAEYNASLLARTADGLYADVGRGRGAVPFFADGPVQLADHWFPGPLTHPYPTVSNCRTDQIPAGNPQLPLVGLPDCAGPKSAFEQVGLTPPPDPAQNPGPSLNDFKALGLPIPDNYGALSYTGLEEDVSVHLQAFRIGDILFTVCSCEQWADQARNIRTRTDRVAGNEWMGFDWATYRGLDDTGVECFEVPPYDGSAWSCPHPESARTTPCYRQANGTWSCPDPTKECLLKGDAFANTCRGKPFDARLPDIPDDRFERMKAQVRNCANGWNAPDWAAYAESEPVAIDHIKGSYTCDDDGASAHLGYALTVPISMANDYNGYIATYREYQRGDHYRKALTGWGPHSSDYMATRMVKLGRTLNGGPGLEQTVDGATDPDADNGVLAAKTAVDQIANDVKAQALGAAGEHLVDAYTRALPDDAGTPEALTQPKDIERFDAALFTWRGGSNYTDNPMVRVERRTGDGWEPFADQSGEVVTTVRFPAKGDLPAYLQGGVQWRWTATFEAFVSRYELLAAPAATPPGTYRFVVDGHRRAGRRTVPYHVVSDQFAVRAWRGITVDDLRHEKSGRVSFRVGPRTEVRVPGGMPDTAVLGPVDYPDSYADAAHAARPRFIKHVRSVVRDPAAPADAGRFEWFCLDCSFRPWRDTGNVKRATVTFARGAKVVARVRARRSKNGRWYTRRHLRHGESAYVCPGAARDPWGDVNGAPSAVVGRTPRSPGCR